ncbi:type IV secretory system conjugative DNA transfer family protein [Nostoc flagelliforme FACHB-838]|uniref:Type IV secretory system conjugative DNA transfer family protein n=1 Tax=Nostoc flagelliforme FACHB-838 TaxID=2692904 RepID=A0ABR8DSM2_9NOSO|nr:type IV secretion system DNA-binding domain-containing protein [Nostoc flagelliforme]MBD2531905.1 type IV secretory system conjugative DNA transfer family protein [Nostoc flagelliforme FACHB-838]
MTAQTPSQQDIGNQIIPPGLETALFSPMGLALLVSVSALALAKFLEGRGGGAKLARARWAGSREKTAARKLACKQIEERKHNRVALFIGTPKNAKVEILNSKKITYLPEDSSSLYLPDAQRGILVCGGAGSGKTFSMINPLVRSAIDQGLPVILYDFKYAHQESATEGAKGQTPKLAGYAVERGYKVTVLAPGFRESAIANPIDFLSSETDAEMARQLAVTLNRNFKLTSGESDKGFFSNAGDQLAQAIFMLVRGTCFPDVMMCQAILSLPNLIERLQQAKCNPWVKASFAQFLSVAGSPETAASIVGNASGLFTRFMVPSALAAFCGQTNIPLDLKGRQMVVFGIDKEKRDVIAPLLVSILHLLVSRNVAKKRSEPLVLALDELPTLYLPALVDWLNQNREDGLVSILGLQNLSLLEQAYGKETTNAIFGGCATKAFFNPQDDVAAERFSKFLGDEQILHKERSRSSGGKSGASTSISDQNSTRNLFEVNQFNSLAEGKAVIVSPGFRSRKDIGLPLLEQIRIPKNDIDSEITSIKTWYEIQQQFVSKSTLREPAGEELERRMLEAEKLLPLVDKKSEIRDKLKGV